MSNNTIKSNGSVTVTTPNVTVKQVIFVNYTTTGSNVIYEAQDIPSGSWIPLATSSLSDLRYGMFGNNTADAVIAVALSASSGYQVITSLNEDEGAAIPFSSSIESANLYARSYVSESMSSALLEYTLVES
jgi:hypothetical protein